MKQQQMDHSRTNEHLEQLQDQWIIVKKQQVDHSRTNDDHLEPLFVSIVLRNLLKVSTEVHQPYFALIYEWGPSVRFCQMSLKCLKTHHILHSFDLRISKYVINKSWLIQEFPCLKPRRYLIVFYKKMSTFNCL